MARGSVKSRFAEGRLAMATIEEFGDLKNGSHLGQKPKLRRAPIRILAIKMADSLREYDGRRTASRRYRVLVESHEGSGRWVQADVDGKRLAFVDTESEWCRLNSFESNKVLQRTESDYRAPKSTEEHRRAAFFAVIQSFLKGNGAPLARRKQ